VADLTDADVQEMTGFLAGACADLKRWLPEPEWRPGWQSEAAAERANREHGPDGPWGEGPVRAVYTAAALYLEAVLQCMRALAASLTPDTTHYVPYCLARAAMEAGSQAYWLLEPGIGARRRVIRFTLLRASGARHRAEEARKTGHGVAVLQGEPRSRPPGSPASMGLQCRYRPPGPHRGWWCEGDKLPGYTERNRALEEAMLSPGAYSIYSAALHAEWHAVTGSWEEVTLDEGTRALVIRPDRVAVWSAVLICAAPAVIPAGRALQLLDHRARSRELGHWVDGTLGLMRRMDLPPSGGGSKPCDRGIGRQRCSRACLKSRGRAIR
jgi:hypothetical protein